MNANEMKAALLKQARDQMAKYPQYAAHFDDYLLCRVTKVVRTKMGLAFQRGEYAICKPGTEASMKLVKGQYVPAEYRTVWSANNRIDTWVESKYVEVVQ